MRVLWSYCRALCILEQLMSTYYNDNVALLIIIVILSLRSQVAPVLNKGNLLKISNDRELREVNKLSDSVERHKNPISTQSCQCLKSSPVFSDNVIVKLSCDQTGSSQISGLTFVTCGFAFSSNTPVKRLKIECFVCNTPNNRFLCLHGIYALYD